MEAHVAQWKKDKVTELVELLQKYSVIGVADMTNMPSPQLQKLRNNLKNVQILMTKARLIKIAIERLKGNVKGIEELEATMKGMPALLLTNENPFKLAKTLNKSKSSAPAKPGQTAPNDILISAGPTPFAPGPVIGELGALGIKATIQDGKVTIKEDKIVVKEGDVISGPVAAMITRLGIEPMEIGINLLATLEKGIIFTKSVLSVDDAAYMSNLRLAASQAFNLAFNIGYPTKENIVLLLQKAARDAEALAESQDILTSGTVTKMITKAEREAKMVVAQSHTYEPQAPRPSTEGP